MRRAYLGRATLQGAEVASKKKKKAATKTAAPKRGPKATRAKGGPKKTVSKSSKRPSAGAKKAKTKKTPARPKPQKAAGKGSAKKSAPKASASKGAEKASAKKKPAPPKPQPQPQAKKDKATGRTQKAAKAPAAAAAPKTAKVKFAPPRAPKTTIRTPEGAEELKQKLGALASAVNQIRSLKRTLNKSFYDIGQILREIRDERLYEVKGYGSFEAFVDREIDLGKQMSLKIVQIVQTFLKEAALTAGLERVSAAREALEGDDEESHPQSSGTTATGMRSPIPLHKQ